MTEALERQEEMVDVRRAALLIGRHPETVRRWVWSGRLSARREGNRLLVARRDVEALADGGRSSTTLAEWAGRAKASRVRREGGKTQSAAALVLDDRRERSRARAGR